MIKNKIRRLPIVHTQKLAGIVTVTDLAVFLSPTRRPGLALSGTASNFEKQKYNQIFRIRTIIIIIRFSS